MVKAGMNGVRINTAYGDFTNAAKMIARLKIRQPIIAVTPELP